MGSAQDSPVRSSSVSPAQAGPQPEVLPQAPEASPTKVQRLECVR